jgi:hypothetical protein
MVYSYFTQSSKSFFVALFKSLPSFQLTSGYAAFRSLQAFLMLLPPEVAKLKLVMDRVKEAYAEKKKTLKGYYPQERWMDYGVPDKR